MNLSGKSVGALARFYKILPDEVLVVHDELGLGADHWTDGELVAQMLAHPILINRPIVVTPWGVKLCRPSDAVLDILPLPQRAPFSKEDGEPVIDAHGRRVR